MHFINDLHNIPATFSCAATIGNFDGVHRGHQQVLTQLIAEAEQRNLPSAVIIFEPQPREFFNPAQAPARLTRLREKLILLAELKIDYVICLSFHQQLAAMSAEDFIHSILIQKLNVKYLLVGEDFRFGQARQGNFELLSRLGLLANMEVAAAPTFTAEGVRISSTLVRQTLALGDFDKARELLGRPFSLGGRIVHGDKRGRELGFPTANINLHRLHSPLHGIYVVQMKFSNHMMINGAASIGTRPTVNSTKMLLEIYLLDFASDIYGEYVQVIFLHKLREELKFMSLAELKSQMAHDVSSSREYFKALDSF